VLTGGRLTLEDAYAYAKFTRLALNTNDIDMRAGRTRRRRSSSLAARVAGRDLEVSYADLEAAARGAARRVRARGRVPDRVPAAAQGGRKRGLAVFSVAALAAPGLRRSSARCCRPCRGPSPPR